MQDAWRKLILVHGVADPATDRFSQLFEPLLVAAATDPVIGELHPYQQLTQLCLRRPEGDGRDDPDGRVGGAGGSGPDAGARPLPAVGVGSTGSYLVVDRPGPGGAVVLETRSVREALECLAALLAPAS